MVKTNFIKRDESLINRYIYIYIWTYNFLEERFMKLRAIIFSLQTVFNTDDLFRFMQLVYRLHPNERYQCYRIDNQFSSIEFTL